MLRGHFGYNRLMILKQFYLSCLAHASYLIADEKSGVAAVVDPQRDVEQYLKAAKSLRVSIKHVLLTHFHADFVSGHLELAREGAKIHLGARAKAGYRFSPMADGDELSLGAVRLKTLETPGHTPEAVCYVVFDDANAPGKPHAVLTGDTLFIGDVGRPDLMASVGASAKQLGGMLYDSLHQKLMPLPDGTLVYPAHGAGSLCGKNLSSDTVSTIGQQRKFNYALKDMTKAQFIKLVTADQPEAPSYFSYDAGLNRSKRPALAARPLKKIGLTQALARGRAGAQLLDTRDPGEFAAGHLPGSVNVGLGGKFASFAGQVLDPSKSIVLVAGKGREKESFLRLARIGLDKPVIGFLPISAVPSKSLVSLRRYTAKELSATLKAVGVLDVRTPAEREASAIPGSRHIPLMQLRRRLKDVPKTGPLVVTCAGGYRSMMAASLLRAAGWRDVSDLEGGMAAWQEAFEKAPA
jgi:hydroxyacylglutathione hydrolase